PARRAARHIVAATTQRVGGTSVDRVAELLVADARRDDLDLEAGRREAVAQNDLPHGRATDVSGADDGDARNTHPESLRRALCCATKLGGITRIGGIRPEAPRFVISPTPATPAGPANYPRGPR